MTSGTVSPGAAIPSTMRALRLLEWSARPVLSVVPVPRPSPGEVLLRVEAAGLCHSDLHVVDAPAGALPYPLPFTLGHEIVGTVVAVGADGDAGWLGTRCAVHGIWSCGSCRMCRSGRDNYCVTLTGPLGGGLGHDGGLAEYVLLPSTRPLVPAAGADPVALAPLTDAGLTAFSAVRPHLPGLEGASVLVVGIGGLGHVAVQLLATARPAALLAVDPRPEARTLATELGATATVGDVADAPGALPAGRADLVVDFVGAPTTVPAAALVADGGDFVLVGSGGGRLTLAKGAGQARGVTVSTPFWGSRDELGEVVRLAAEGVVRAETETFVLDEAVDAYDRLRAGEVRGRAVVVPGPVGTAGEGGR
ncbi:MULTISPECIES: alcohol dehydrogenase catalytic domain-containing protein [unclassified Blastococcus]